MHTSALGMHGDGQAAPPAAGWEVRCAALTTHVPLTACCSRLPHVSRTLRVQLVSYNADAQVFGYFRLDLDWLDSGLIWGATRLLALPAISYGAAVENAQARGWVAGLNDWVCYEIALPRGQGFVPARASGCSAQSPLLALLCPKTFPPHLCTCAHPKHLQVQKFLPDFFLIVLCCGYLLVTAYDIFVQLHRQAQMRKLRTLLREGKRKEGLETIHEADDDNDDDDHVLGIGGKREVVSSALRHCFKLLARRHALC